MNEFLFLIYSAASSAFLQVTVFVGGVLILFGYFNFKKEGKLIQAIINHKNCQPCVGALLGLTPGCGGAILIMPFYVKRTVTFGTVVSTLIATSGDAAFVLISSAPLDFVMVSVISFFVAIISGHLVDYLKLEERFHLHSRLHTTPEQAIDHEKHKHACIHHIGHEDGDRVDLILHHQLKGHQLANTSGYKITHKGYFSYWIFLLAGLVIGLSLFFVPKIMENPMIAVFGVVGTMLSIFLMLAGKKYLVDDTHEEIELKMMSLKETMIHNSQETAFVGTWVFAAYLIYETAVFALGGGDSAQGQEIIRELMNSAGLIAVLVGALIGLIPGCGPQILFISLYLKGIIPFPALIANVISQDGDALLPLLAMDKKAAFAATIVTTIPALIVGFLLYLIL